MRGLSDKVMRRLIWLLLVLALYFLGSAFYIPAKAMLAQQLLQQAWAETLHTHGQVSKPWPWADTWPVARLIVPAHHIDQIVLEGDMGNSLAFAPGQSLQSFTDKVSGAIMISGHRDTHFHFLKDIALGNSSSCKTKLASSIATRYRTCRLSIPATARLKFPVPADGCCW